MTPASEKQIAFLTRLLGERPTYAAGLALDLAGLSKSEASKAIEAALARPKESKPSDTPKVTEAGFYLNPETSEVFRVRPTKYNPARLYAEKLIPATEDGVKGHFAFVAGLVHKLDPAWLLSFEEALRAGRHMGFCVRCGALLTLKKSVDRGMGPVCYGHHAKAFGLTVKQADAYLVKPGARS